MFLVLKHSEYFSLLDAVSTAIFEALQNLDQSEPQLVADLVYHLPEELNRVRLKHGKKICVGGVFVHSSTFVKIQKFPAPKPSSVEIGDLLLVRTVRSKEKVLERRAFLLQAKKITRIPVKPDNQNQHHLYAEWPPFEYVRSKNLNGKKRHIQGPELYDGAKYFLIANNRKEIYIPCCVCCICHSYHLPVATAKATRPQLSGYTCFYSEIINFIIGNAGRSYVQPNSKDIGWNRVIDDLLSETAQLVSVYTKRNGTEKDKRGSGLLHFISGRFDKQASRFTEVDATFRTDDPPELPDKREPEEGGGISTIEFVIQDDELRRADIE